MSFSERLTNLNISPHPAQRKNTLAFVPLAVAGCCAALVAFIPLRAVSAVPLFDAGFRSYSAGRAPTAVAIADLDGDGHADLAVSSQTDGVTLLHGLGDGSFAPWKSTPSYDGSSLVLADMNHDQIPDLVVAGYYSPDVSVSFGSGDGQFGILQHYTTGPSPRGVRVADVNQDGIPDLVLCNSDLFYGNSVSVFLGRAAGTFENRKDSPLPQDSGPDDIATGDLNGDGILDLVVGAVHGNNVYSMLGHGDGTFTEVSESVAWDDPPAFVDLADFNEDGKLDIITSGSPATLLLGNGDGTFGSRIQLGAGAGKLVVADFNHDGHLDVAFTGGDVAGVLLGNGKGSFATVSVYETGFETGWIDVGDVNGDGALDLVTSSQYSGTVSVLLGNGNGTFGKGEKYPVGTHPTCATAGDFDGDGFADLAIANVLSGEVSLLRGRGDGSFLPAAGLLAGPTGLVLADDLNHDGRGDLILARHGISVLLATAAMNFGAAAYYEDSLGFQSIAVGDLNGDGFLDVAATFPVRIAGDVRHPVWIPQTAVYVLFGRGDGSLAEDTVYTAGQGTYDLAIADVDGNGHNDLVVVNNYSSTISAFLSDESGRLREPVSYPTLFSPTGLTVGDFDGDGLPDIVTITNSSPTHLGLMRGTGAGQFGPPKLLGTFDNARAIAASDFDQDGHVDLALSTDYSNGATILRGMGDATFSAAEIYGTGTGPDRMAIRDFDGDGRPDLAVPNSYMNTVSILKRGSSNVTTPALVWLEGVSASPKAVRLVWRSETLSIAQVRVDRSSGTESWTSLGRPTADGTDRFVLEDESVREGESYTYRLVLDGSQGPTIVSVVAVQVPVVHVLDLAVMPNPMRSEGQFAFHLSSSQRASLEIWNVGGRRVWSQEVGRLGPGSHVFEFPHVTGLASGAYLLRLVQDQRSVVRRFTLIR